MSSETSRTEVIDPVTERFAPHENDGAGLTESEWRRINEAAQAVRDGELGENIDTYLRGSYWADEIQPRSLCVILEQLYEYGYTADEFVKILDVHPEAVQYHIVGNHCRCDISSDGSGHFETQKLWESARAMDVSERKMDESYRQYAARLSEVADVPEWHTVTKHHLKRLTNNASQYQMLMEDTFGIDVIKHPDRLSELL